MLLLAGLLGSSLPPAASHARERPIWAPVPIGRFGDWGAARRQEAGQTICYAYVFAKSSRPTLTGRGRVVLTVTRRPNARPTLRNAVAMSLGYQVLPHAGARVRAGGRLLRFYLEGRSAFAPDGAEAVRAFQAGREAIGQFPGPRNLTLTDTFSLTGFSAAYAAIGKACGE